MADLFAFFPAIPVNPHGSKAQCGEHPEGSSDPLEALPIKLLHCGNH